MLSDEEKQAIEYLKSRLYGNEGCKIIDVAQSDLRIFLKLAANLQKDIESWKKYCNEQENDITLKNNKICDLEFKIEKQSKEIEEMKKQIDLDNECEIALNSKVMDLEKEIEELKVINQMQKYRIEVIDERELISKDKIKAKIEEVKDGTYDAKIVLESLLEKE